MHRYHEILGLHVIKDTEGRFWLVRNCGREVWPIDQAGISAGVTRRSEPLAVVSLGFQSVYFALRSPAIETGNPPLRHSVRSGVIIMYVAIIITSFAM